MEQLELVQLKELTEMLLLFFLKHQQVVEVVALKLLVTLEDLEAQVVELALEEELQDLEEQEMTLLLVPFKEGAVETVQEQDLAYLLEIEAAEVVVELDAQELMEQDLE